MSDLPPVLVQNVLEGWGDRGTQWLAALPELIDTFAERWQLSVGPAYPMSFHWWPG